MSPRHAAAVSGRLGQRLNLLLDCVLDLQINSGNALEIARRLPRVQRSEMSVSFNQNSA